MISTAHALLRDRSRWQGRLRGLAVTRSGDLALMRVPGTVNGKPVVIPRTPANAGEASGIAFAADGSLFVADRLSHRIQYVDPRCAVDAWLPTMRTTDRALESLRNPRGLAVDASGLWVADSGHCRLQHYAFPRLERNLQIDTGGAPGAIAVDSWGRILVIVANALRRVLPDGASDPVFDAAIAASALRAPLSIACTEALLLVSDASCESVLLFDHTGRSRGTLSGPAGWKPGAIAAMGTRAYVADRASGHIAVFEDGQWHGYLPDWTGAVSALALSAGGDLAVKPSLDARYITLSADCAYTRDGELIAGPFDAGEQCVWERVWVDATVPAATEALAYIALTDTANEPGAGDWLRLTHADTLLIQPDRPSARFAWLHVAMRSADRATSPTLAQARLATAAEEYLDYLPLTYRRHDADAFLARWMKLVRGEFLRIEEAIALLNRLADPGFIPPQWIEWLAQWLGLELPAIADDAQRRALIATAIARYARRGTPDSIAEFVALHTGIRPTLVEAFEERRIWMLGVTSRLGFDTRLPALDPDGVVIADCTAEPPCPGPTGRAVVGAGGPLTASQVGMPLFAETAYRFCVLVDAYRVQQPGMLDEVRRIVDREKPAHTDYRIEVIPPQFRIGYQARIGIDAIVGEPVAGTLAHSTLSVDAHLAAADAARIGIATLDTTLTLT